MEAGTVTPEMSRRLAAVMLVATADEKIVLHKAMRRMSDNLGTTVLRLVAELEARAGSLIAEVDRLKRELDKALGQEQDASARAAALEEELWEAQHPRPAA